MGIFLITAYSYDMSILLTFLTYFSSSIIERSRSVTISRSVLMTVIMNELLAKTAARQLHTFVISLSLTVTVADKFCGNKE